MSRSHFWRHPLCLAPRPLRPWLTEAGSLTARLKKDFPSLAVQVLKQGRQHPLRDEWFMLNLPGSHPQVAVREVLLLNGKNPLIFAHSIAPRHALRGDLRLLAGAGTRPLGEILFADPTIARSPLGWCRVDCRHPLWRRAQAATGLLPRQLWARRSVFFSGPDRLLVTELFLPAMTLAK